MNRIWTAVSTNRSTGQRCRNVFNGGVDYDVALKEFNEEFPGHMLEVLAPGTVEMKTFSTGKSRSGQSLRVNPLNDMPSGF